MAARISILPSALGSKCLLLFALLELAFLATNYSNLFFLLLAFSAVLGVLGAYWARCNLCKLHIASIEAPVVASGATRVMQLQLTADRRPRFDLLLELDLQAGYTEAGYTPCLIASSTMQGNLAGQPRGVRKLQSVRVSSGFPFGFFVARTMLPIDSELITHPIPATSEQRGAVDGHASDQGALSAGRGSALAGLREFRTGDSLGDVHWKATARRGKAIVKERERESAPAVDMVLDRRCEAPVLEQALSLLTAQVLAARHGAPLRMYSQGMELAVDPDRGGANEALRWLAQADPLATDAPPPPSRPRAMHLPATQRSQ